MYKLFRNLVVSLVVAVVLIIGGSASAQVFPSVTLSSFDKPTGTYVYTVTCPADSTYPFGYLQIDTQVANAFPTGPWTMQGALVGGVNKNWPLGVIRWDAANGKDSAIWDPISRGTVISANTYWTGQFILIVPDSEPVPGYAATRDGVAGSYKVHEVLVPGPKHIAPPVTGFTVEGDMGQNDWYVSPVKVTITATDPDDDYDYSLYTLNNLDWLRYESPVEFNEDGVFNLLAKSVDTELSWEPDPKSLDLNIDVTGPVVSGSPASAPNINGWYRNDVQINYTAMDKTSGLQAPEDKAPGENSTFAGKISGEGVNLSDTASATDKAGNGGSFTVAGVKIDRTAPVITVQNAPEGCNHIQGFRFWRHLRDLIRAGVDESTDPDFFENAKITCGDDEPDRCSHCRRWHLIHYERAIIRFTAADSLSGLDGQPWVGMQIDPIDDRCIPTPPAVKLTSLGGGAYEAAFDMTIPGQYAVAVHAKDLAGNVTDLADAATFRVGGFWVDWLSPICHSDTYVMEDGATLPVKFRLKDPGRYNACMNNYNYVVKVFRIMPDGSKTLMGTYTPDYDRCNSGYQVNVKTKDQNNKDWPVGDYIVTIEGPGIWDQKDGPYKSQYSFRLIEGGKSQGRGRK